MDWNIIIIFIVFIVSVVTLHTESMDWNCADFYHFRDKSCYSPHGEYGLKLVPKLFVELIITLLSTRRVWIEIGTKFEFTGFGIQLLSTRRVWIEIQNAIAYLEAGKLLSTRRVWIEIFFSPRFTNLVIVTLHTESMDWNCRWCNYFNR